MRSGQLKDKITINKPSDERTPEGDELGTVIKVFDARANVHILSASELLKSGLSLTTEYASVLMRLDSRLEYQHSINFNGNEYEVESIRPTDNRMDMIVTISRDIV